MEKFTLAMSRFRRNKLDQCIILCDEILKENETDLAVQVLKTHAIRKKSYIDDLEIDDEGLGDKLLDEHKISNQIRPGTSIQRPGTQGVNQAIRPMSSAGRPISGVVRPNSRAQNVESRGLKGLNRGQTGQNRAITSGGRNVRMATATLQSINSSSNLNLADIKAKSIIKNKTLAKVLI
jgi:hypothetical protein